MHVVRYILQSLQNTASARQGSPWLQADKRRIRMGRMPDAQIRHLRTGKRDAVGIQTAPENDLPRGALENYGLVIKQAVVKRKDAAVLKRKRRILTVYKAAWGEADADWIGRLREYQLIVRKPKAGCQGYGKAWMSAVAEMHGLAANVVHMERNLQGTAVQSIGERAVKGKRICLQKRFAGCQSQPDRFFRLAFQR